MNLQIAVIPVQGRNVAPDYIWTLHDGQSVIAVSQAQWWTIEQAKREGQRYARNFAIAVGAVHKLNAEAKPVDKVEKKARKSAK